jgi:putative AlgH/UPF0301 family transcriptional regulator
MILAAWKWSAVDSSFKLYFGIDTIKARQLIAQDDGFELYGFMGHSGWGESQLESELEETAWIVASLLPEFEKEESEALWRKLLLRAGPEMSVLIDEPDDPSVN